MLRPSRARLVHALRLPAGAPVIVRPVGPRDAGVLQAYVRGLPAESRYNRFFGPLRELPPAELDRVIHLDRRRQMAMIAETCLDGGARVIGEARYALAPDGGDLEFALSVADEFRHQGVGMLLMADLETGREISARSASWATCCTPTWPCRRSRARRDLR